jgi:hypothetical protein
VEFVEFVKSVESLGSYCGVIVEQLWNGDCGTVIVELQLWNCDCGTALWKGNYGLNLDCIRK